MTQAVPTKVQSENIASISFLIIHFFNVFFQGGEANIFFCVRTEKNSKIIAA